MWEGIVLAGIIVVILLYEKVWRVRKCEAKIAHYIREQGGVVLSIEKLTPREELYNVRYHIDRKEQRLTIKFGVFYDMTFA